MRRRPLLTATVLIALIGAGIYAARRASRPVSVDTLLLHARLLDGSTVSVAIDDGVVVQAGGAPELSRRYIAKTRIDAAGGLLLHGFRDAHVHMKSGGLAQLDVQLAGFPSVAAQLAEVARYAREHPDLEWIRGRGWNYKDFDDGLPHRSALDEVLSDRPVVLEAYDGHALWVNSKALELTGITAATECPEGGTLVTDRSGATGVFLESAEKLVYDRMPPRPESQLERALEDAIESMIAHGVTSVVDIPRDAVAQIERYEALAAGADLPIDLQLFPILMSPVTAESWKSVDAAVAAAKELSSVAVVGVKVFLDGVIESKTAAMLEPYVDSTENGSVNYELSELVKIVREANSRSLGVAIHAIGDRAVRLALDAFEGAGGSAGLPRCIEHIEVVSPDDLPRFAKLGVRASMQPLHANPGGPDPDSEIWSRNLGVDRLPWTFPWKALKDAGADLVFGSDWPVVSNDPLHGLAVAVTRQSRSGEPEGGWYAHQALSLPAALEAYGATLEQPIANGAEVDWVVLAPHVDPRAPETLWHPLGDSAPRVRCVLRGRTVHRF